MQVQQVLRSAVEGIDGNGHPVARRRPAKARVDERLGGPGVGEPVGATWGKQAPVFDAGDVERRHHQILLGPVDVLEHGVAPGFPVGQVDLDARRRPAGSPLVGHALAMNDPPQSLAVGVKRRRRQVRGGRRAEGREQQGEGNEETQAHADIVYRSRRRLKAWVRLARLNPPA